jgi:DNA replication protein DnaC
MTNMTQPIDAQRLTLVLNELRLPAIKQTWPDIAARSDKEGWPAARFLAALAEHEIAERDRRPTRQSKPSSRNRTATIMPTLKSCQRQSDPPSLSRRDNQLSS